jgi:hypothetical protein
VRTGCLKALSFRFEYLGLQLAYYQYYVDLVVMILEDALTDWVLGALSILNTLTCLRLSNLLNPVYVPFYIFLLLIYSLSGFKPLACL